MKVTLDNGPSALEMKNGILELAESKASNSDNSIQDDTACIYSPYGANNLYFGTYSKQIVEANALRTVDIAYRQAQNNLKILGFYSGSVATDGNMKSSESIKAIRNFQTVYGLSVTGVWNNATADKLTSAINTYNEVYSSSGSSTVAQIKNGYSDYNEPLLKNNISKIWSFLKVGMGLDDVHASAVMGNIMEESGGSSTNAQDTDGDEHLFDNSYTYNCYDNRGYGIIQWTYYSRKEGLQNTASSMGLSVSDINAQMAYFREEAEGDYNSAWNSFLLTNTIDGATNTFREYFEQTPNGADERREFANIVYNTLCG